MSHQFQSYDSVYRYILSSLFIHTFLNVDGAFTPFMNLVFQDLGLLWNANNDDSKVL